MLIETPIIFKNIIKTNTNDKNRIKMCITKTQIKTMNVKIKTHLKYE